MTSGVSGTSHSHKAPNQSGSSSGSKNFVVVQRKEAEAGSGFFEEDVVKLTTKETKKQIKREETRPKQSVQILQQKGGLIPPLGSNIIEDHAK